MTTDTTRLSSYLLDYYAALAENMPNPRLRKYEREDTFICVINDILYSPSICLIQTYSPTTNPALALPIIDMMLLKNFYFQHDHKLGTVFCGGCGCGLGKIVGDNITEAALRALVAWKFPDGLPEPVYEKEEKNV